MSYAFTIQTSIFIEGTSFQVRASAVFALGTLLDVGIDSSRDIGGNGECDDDEKVRAENSIVESLLNVVSDGSPLVRAEVAIGMWTIGVFYVVELFITSLISICSNLSFETIYI